MGCAASAGGGRSPMSWFLGLRRPRFSLNASLFFLFGVASMVLAGPRVVRGLEEQAPPLPTFSPVVGSVTRIVDGDTFWIGRTKIRLWGIDAPETSTPNGPIATRFLGQVVGDHPLTCRQAGPPSYDGVTARK